MHYGVVLYHVSQLYILYVSIHAHTYSKFMHTGFYSSCIDINTCTCKTHTKNMHGIIQCHNTTNTYKSCLVSEQKHIICEYMWICVNVNPRIFILSLGGVCIRCLYECVVLWCCIIPCTSISVVCVFCSHAIVSYYELGKHMQWWYKI